MKTYELPLLIRGELITQCDTEFGGRRGGAVFRTPSAAAHIGELPLARPADMADMYELRMADIFEYLDQLGKRLKLDDNPYLQEAFEVSCATSGLTPDILRNVYTNIIPPMFQADRVRQMVETRIGVETLEGWTKQELGDGRVDYTRPLGARCLHITAGNSPMTSAVTVIWNAITRGDALVKSPSNDPLSSLAIGRTMVDMAPDHPLTKHYSVAYWKGGDREFESELYAPENFEKIIAWGGFGSMKHITRYLQPGLELVAMDPKLSGTIIGEEVFASDDTMRDVASRLARDIGKHQQEGCVSARVVSVQSSTDEAGLARLRRLAELTYDALQDLDPKFSGPHHHFDPDLKDEIAGIRNSRFYDVIGKDDNRGAIIVSRIAHPVDFADQLSCRVANFVPFTKIEDALDLITIHTQTIGVYPKALKERYREKLAFLGGQRIVDVGHHHANSWNLPHDAMEPIRRLCRWINDEGCEEDEAGASPAVAASEPVPIAAI